MTVRPCRCGETPELEYAGEVAYDFFFGSLDWRELTGLAQIAPGARVWMCYGCREWWIPAALVLGE